MTVHTLRWRDGWARITPWRHDGEVARLTVSADAPPRPSEIERCVEALRARGYDEVVTSALSPADAMPFVDAGFAVRERLHLLALDAHAFDGFWRLDGDGLTDAVRATPATRFRVTTERPARREVSGYAVTGCVGRRGYLQRVAVHPAARRRGLGRALVADALWWLRGRASARALVNTQLDNTAALALYESCGFRRLPAGLCVLGRTL